jgi:hypothetical protein
MKIIGLMGYAGVGKDAVAGILTEEHRFMQVRFAESVRDHLLELNPLVDVDGEPVPLGDVIEQDGWDSAKRSFPEVRRLLQAYGQHMRDHVHENYWVFKAFDRVPITHVDAHHPGELEGVVYSDVRYPNEAQYVTGHGGALWTIKRPGFGQLNGHASDQPVWDTAREMGLTVHTVVNDKTINDLKAKVARALVAS